MSTRRIFGTSGIVLIHDERLRQNVEVAADRGIGDGSRFDELERRFALELQGVDLLLGRGNLHFGFKPGLLQGHASIGYGRNERCHLVVSIP